MVRPPAAPAAPHQAPLGPGDIPGLFECLQGALQPGTQKQCEAVLLGLEQRPGYSSCLLVTFSPSSAVCLRVGEAITSACPLMYRMFAHRLSCPDNTGTSLSCTAITQCS